MDTISFETFLGNQDFTLDVYRLDVFVETLLASSNAAGKVTIDVPAMEVGVEHTVYCIYDGSIVGYQNLIMHDAIHAISMDLHRTLKAPLENGLTWEDMTKLSTAALISKTQLVGSVFTILSPDGATERIIATVDQEGNRLAVTHNVS